MTTLHDRFIRDGYLLARFPDGWWDDKPDGKQKRETQYHNQAAMVLAYDPDGSLVIGSRFNEDEIECGLRPSCLNFLPGTVFFHATRNVFLKVAEGVKGLNGTYHYPLVPAAAPAGFKPPKKRTRRVFRNLCTE